MPNAGIIYVLTNEAMQGFVKIGKTVNLEDRLRSLYSTGVPFPFHCEKAVRVADMDQVERALHDVLDNNRVNPNREFFEVEPEKVFRVLDALALEDVTPNADFVENVSDTEALNRRKKQRPPIQLITMLGLNVGDTLTTDYIPGETCTVATDRTVNFRGEEISLSKARNILREEHDLDMRSAATFFWKFEGTTLRKLYREAYNDFDDR